MSKTNYEKAWNTLEQHLKDSSIKYEGKPESILINASLEQMGKIKKECEEE